MSGRESWIHKFDSGLKPDGERPWRPMVVSMMEDAVKDIDSPTIVDVGCGLQSWALAASGIENGEKIGVDPDPDAMSNKDVDRVVIAPADHIPLPDATADLVISSYLLEHVENPSQALREFARILKPGGRLIVWTPNKYNYAIALSSLTPCWLHNWARRLAKPGASKDNCPTFYRANTPRGLKRLMRNAGLELTDKIRFGATAYQYWKFSKWLFAIAAFGSRIASATPLECLKSILIAQAVKPNQSYPLPTHNKSAT